MVFLPQSQHGTAQAIADWYAAKTEAHRPHLGASVIGHNCNRHVWLTFRWAKLPDFNWRIKRLFDTGKREEDRVFKELKAIGVELHTHDNGKQIECRDDSGHFGGSVDAIGIGFKESPKTWAVLEIKTHNAKSFADLEKKGVEESKPRHYAQMQVYMSLMKLDRAYYFAVNKDNDEIYGEWVHFNKKAYDAIYQRAKTVIEAQQPPDRISQDPAYWECKTCDFYNLCHQDKLAAVNCRTCVHATPQSEGKWHCEYHKMTITETKQNAACSSHMFIPALVPFADAVDAAEGYVEYQHKVTGKTFKNGEGHYQSKELAMLPSDIVTEGIVHEIKTKIPKSKIKKVTSAAEDKPFYDDPIPF